jgi:tryptophanyl-tRNA synthetase
MTQFKDKSSSMSDDRVSVGLFNYPVLMAADILLYGATYVPVGDDQTQHLEFTRDIAERLNKKFNKELFVIPKSVNKQHEFFGNDQGLRIKDLQDPTMKMSKSDDSGKGVIFMGDNPGEAANKIMSATTDSLAKVQIDWENQPGISNLIQILSLLTNKTNSDIESEWQDNPKYGDFKVAVADEVQKFLETFQAKLAKVDDKAVTDKLEESELAMNKVANTTLLRVQQAVGLRA